MHWIYSIILLGSGYQVCLPFSGKDSDFIKKKKSVCVYTYIHTYTSLELIFNVCTIIKTPEQICSIGRLALTIRDWHSYLVMCHSLSVLIGCWCLLCYELTSRINGAGHYLQKFEELLCSYADGWN